MLTEPNNPETPKFTLEIVGLVIAFLSLVAAIIVIPEIRCYFELDKTCPQKCSLKGYTQGIKASNYLRGYKVKKNCNKVWHFLQESINYNNPIGFYNLAFMKEYGACTERDLLEAERYYAKAIPCLKKLSKKGNIHAKVYLSAIYRTHLISIMLKF